MSDSGHQHPTPHPVPPFDRPPSLIDVSMDPEHDHTLPTLPANPPQPHASTSAPAPAPESGVPPTSPILISPGPPPQTFTSTEKFEDDSISARGSSPPRDGNHGPGTSQQPLRPLALPRITTERPPIRRARTVDTHRSRRSAIDYIVPVDELKELPPRPRTVGERLDPTLITARSEKEKYALKAKMTGYALNAAIGMQVILGALTTGLSAATSGHNTSIAISILGGLATLVASYLARARGSNEPELSITRVKDLEQFIRECEAFKMDLGHETGNKYDEQLLTLRRRFEELLGNANGERRLAPPV